MFGLNSAVKGLLASQRSLYTTNHNITNANTKGYSRQQIDQRATRAHNLPGIGFMGTGTEIYNIDRVRDSFTDFKYWNESAPMGEWDVKRNALGEIEKLMGEPTDNSFRQYMDDLYTSLEDLSKNPSDRAFREPVRENAMSFTKHFNETAKRLENMRNDTEYDMGVKVKHINSLGDQIGKLNRQIYLRETGGNSANDLRDRRELLVDDLSKIVNVQVSESEYRRSSDKNNQDYDAPLSGKYTVSVNGISLVDHTDINKIIFNGDKEEEKMIVWENGQEVKLRSGELKAMKDMLAGNGEENSYRGIPFYEKKLDQFAQIFAEKFNEQHKKGKKSDGENGKDFFVFDENNPAASLSLSKEILDSVDNIAAGFTGSAEDGENILALIKQREDKNFFPDKMSQGTPDDFLKSILSSMAVDSLQAQRSYSTQEIIQRNIGSKRASISGVSLDEEMADMVRFQHIYVAASKMITTMDSLLDLTVNRLGNVGR